MRVFCIWRVTKDPSHAADNIDRFHYVFLVAQLWQEVAVLLIDPLQHAQMSLSSTIEPFGDVKPSDGQDDS